ncbi:hypothetical protein GCM10011490_28680 [Pseudoclavibacter endophyticus]|uniref:Uncharacterized protein n=1 Tax=Pseudoclavibacter endophyticus TaxID=1778590 RepID=A0A6H9WA76_9MICO|nr:hypothetical protein [Pseudoclavibacter endophyticus]KAB1646717.1 hypothetical protein F8O04_13295 [Pseudoclavibacter endophyticus]GGA76146.1 hypothetical protein GCM10011490_28680 [Pseudoclavibacter endophyticus]
MNVNLLIPRPAAVRETVRGVVRQQLNATLWRITRQSGEVLGYVEHLGEVGHPYRAKRMLPDRRGFMGFGDFDDLGEAVEALRH